MFKQCWKVYAVDFHPDVAPFGISEDTGKWAGNISGLSMGIRKERRAGVHAPAWWLFI